MPHDRFFLNTFFRENTHVTLTGNEAHHLERVMRKSKGETVELVNGKCQLAQAEVVKFEKKIVHLKLTHIFEKKPFCHIVLCQAIPRLNRLDTIVEKGTELGMTELWLFPGDLSEKKDLTPSNLHRLESISISALKQCGRLDLPKICIKMPLEKWSALPSQAFFGDLSENAPTMMSVFQKSESTYFFIGPESGFSIEEIAHLQRMGAVGISLNPFTLRTETASLTALSQIAFLMASP